MLTRLSVIVVGLAAIGLAQPAIADPGDELGALITERLRADGPWFNAEEQAVIGRACGYAPGEWDGYDVSIDDETLTCTNGRRVSDPEVRRVLRAASPRIEARVAQVMDSAEIEAAIARVAEQATAEAMAAVQARFAEHEADED